MRRTSIPISIVKFKTQSGSESEAAKYLVTLDDSGSQWKQSMICDRQALEYFKSVLDKVLEDTSTAELLGVSVEKAAVIDKHHKEDDLCQGCKFKMTNRCKVCLFELQSPLERKLYVKLSEAGISFNIQIPFSWEGEQIFLERGVEISEYFKNEENRKASKLLTIPDFLIQKRNVKLCIYADGHTYHERTEDQASHDRRIDRKLQELGFQVLRYTGKEINENADRIVNEIKNRLP